jgi:hypothetical protein
LNVAAYLIATASSDGSANPQRLRIALFSTVCQLGLAAMRHKTLPGQEELREQAR